MSHRPADTPVLSRVFVTGAAGFIGGHLCQHLKGAGVWRQVPFVRGAQSAELLRTQGLEAVQGDLRNPVDVVAGLKGCDAVVHLAHGEQGPKVTRCLLQLAAKHGVKRFVYVSSMAVHGPAPGPEAAREASARIGRYAHDYSDSKAEQEEAVQAAYARGDVEVVILRPTIVYGPAAHFVMQVVQEARAGAYTVFDEGRGVCNAVYVDDVCRAIEAALQTTRAVGEAMFITDDHPITWGEFISTFAMMVQPLPRRVQLSSAAAVQYWAVHPPAPPPALWLRAWRKVRHLGGWQPPLAPWPPLGRVQRECFPVAFSNEKAKTLLDWSPQVSFQRGAELTRAWLSAKGHLL
ncbi:NAD-dependent epimerase/dehydratase family protein [Rubrivivax rivuli]|uniref:NAD-dependent epimerase/dehydratase family protein n=1 Tax=Rubrivivax rivuli TaxID=1862385 RepID=UPI0013E2D910|nr:NAD(P)-dependent oxidoreductase [Rubrivivax rivuli]